MTRDMLLKQIKEENTKALTLYTETGPRNINKALLKRVLNAIAGLKHSIMYSEDCMYLLIAYLHEDNKNGGWFKLRIVPA